MTTNTPDQKRIGTLEAIRNNHKGNEANTQAKRLLIALKALGSLTTIEIRRHLDILAPAAKIFDLRYRQNQNILLSWETTETDAGIKHKIGRYSLVLQTLNEVTREAA
jgi:hypothetical protein